MPQAEAEKVETVIELDKAVIETLNYYAKQEDMNIDSYVQRMMSDGFTIATLVGESVVRLSSVDPWIPEELLDPVGEDGSETPKTTAVYEDLRENFPPVSAGIDYPKSFTSGSGFDVKIDDLEDQHQITMKESIDKFNRAVFMDEHTRGLDLVLDILLDDVFTYGVAAAEIVYTGWEEESMIFEQWAIPRESSEANPAQWEPKDLVDSDWRRLKGIRQLKIIENAYHRLKPYRDPVTWKILYFTIDEEKASNKRNAEIKKLLPWQVLWLSWNRRNNKLKGVSTIKSVADTALLLKKILRDIGITFDKWADQKYFFVLGDARSGRTWAPQHVANFSRDVQKMVKDKGTGIPVPAGFDVKSIGGEGGIYDGGQIIDQLLTMICTGMKYPKAFLYQENKGDDDKAWLAWLVRYNRDQTQLRRIIEDHLWRRHLYTEHGMFRRVSQRGVPIADQEYVAIYVPEMEWSSEGKWHQETKLKMLKSLLDSANPLTAETKYHIERDMMRTLGYPEKTIEPQIEIIKIDRQADLIESKIELLKKEMELEVTKKAKEDGTYLELEPILRFVKSPEEEEEQEGEFSKRPPPDPQKRLEGGVSRTTKDKKTSKGEAKPQGESRKPKVRSVGEAGPPSVVDVNINVKLESDTIKTEPVTIKLEAEPQKIDVKLETEPQKITVDTTHFQEPVIIKVDEEGLEKQRNILLLDQENLKKDVRELIDKRIQNIDDITDRNKEIYKEIRKERREMKKLEEHIETISVKDATELELKKKKIEFMKELMKEEREKR
jgi:hypothetical protein